MGTKQPKRVAAALALATGLTVFGGMAAHADTVSAPSNTAPSVAPVDAANAPSDMTSAGVTFGPYPNWAVCQAARLAGGKAADPCYQAGDGQWYYVAHS